jgi:hypothetical protein
LTTFKVSEKAFMERSWVEAALAKVPYTAHGNKSYVDYMLEHTVKARNPESRTSSSEFEEPYAITPLCLTSSIFR